MVRHPRGAMDTLRMVGRFARRIAYSREFMTLATFVLLIHTNGGCPGD